MVMELCRELVASGEYVLHGSNARPALLTIEPRQANDALKAAGNLMAVYAGTNVEAALMHAVLDREYLASRFEHYTMGYRVIAGRTIFKATDNVYELLREGDSRVFADGYVYALARHEFTPVHEGGFEFYSVSAAVPQVTLSAPARLGKLLVAQDPGQETLVRYSHEESLRLRAHEARLTA